MKILLENAKILLNNRELKRFDIVVDSESGKICKIGLGISKRDYDIKIRLENHHIVLPGFVDIHVHCRDWKQSHKETIETCSMAAAAGGVVKIFDMPNTDPKIDNVELYLDRLKYCREKSKVEYYLHAGVPRKIEELYRYYESGVRSIKVYPEDIERLVEENLIDEFFKICEKFNILLIFHCEDLKIIRDMYLKYEHNFKNHRFIRCRDSEISCINFIISKILRFRNIRVHFTHVSTVDSIKIINRYRQYSKITLDITPHHLILTDEMCFENSKFENICKVNPPLRDSYDRDGIFVEFLNGRVDCVVSDHAPHSIDEKLRDYDICPPGFPGLETTSLILLSLWRYGFIDIVDAVKLYCENPCKIVGIEYPKICENSFADMCIVDVKREKVVDSSKFRSLSKYSPFDGFRVPVSIVATFYHGKPIFIDEYYYDYFSKLL